MTMKLLLRRFVEFFGLRGFGCSRSTGVPECGVSRERRQNDVFGRRPPLLKRLPTSLCRVCSVCRHFPTIGKKMEFTPPFKPPREGGGNFGGATLYYFHPTYIHNLKDSRNGERLKRFSHDSCDVGYPARFQTTLHWGCLLYTSPSPRD